MVTTNNDKSPFFVSLYDRDKNQTIVEIPLDWGEQEPVTATVNFDKETGRVLKIV